MEDSTRVSQYFALLSAMNPQSGKQRGQRSSCDMIYRVVELYEQGTPVLQVAAAVGVGAKTVARYLRLYRGCRSPADVEAVAPARGGRRAESVKLGEIELDFLMDELAVDPTLGVEEYRERLDTELGVQVSATQICWVLNHTLKQHMKKVTLYRPERLSAQNMAVLLHPPFGVVWFGYPHFAYGFVYS